MAGKRPMKGDKPDPKHPLRFPLYVSLKLDGIRLMMDKLVPKTASMKSLPNVYTKEALTSDPSMCDLDMELICGPANAPDVYRVTESAVMTIAGEPEVDFYVFDIVILDMRFEERLELLNELAPSLPRMAHVVEYFLVHTQEELDALYAWALENNYEGLVTRSPDGMYKFGRSTPKEQWMLKLKPEDTSEFIITGFYEAMENQNTAFTNELGKTARSTAQDGKVGKGTLGGFLGYDIHNPAWTELRIPCGKLKHDERQHIWDNQQDYLGKLGFYKFFTIGLKDAPRQARWYGWRKAADLDPELAIKYAGCDAPTYNRRP